MTRAVHPRVVTANHLLEGEVVWMTADGRWTTRLAEAEVFADPDRAEARLREATRQSGVVVGAYLCDVRAGPHGISPTHIREALRTAGPSNYAHGKQAEQ